jgi:hypothetical protein
VGCCGLLVLLVSAISPASIQAALGVQIVATAYLLLLVSLYQVGVPMPTRGGVVLKQKAPWLYRGNFFVLSLFGSGPLFISVSNAVVASTTCTSPSDYLRLIVMVASGVAAVGALAFGFSAAIIGTLVSIYRGLRRP